MHLLNRPTNGVIVAKNSDLKMLCTLLLSLSTNCKNAMLKLTQNTSRKVIATNGSEVCKIGHHYPVLTLWGWGGCSRPLLVGSLSFQSGRSLRQGPGSLSLCSVREIPHCRIAEASVYGAEPRAGDPPNFPRVAAVVGERTGDTIESSCPETLPGANSSDQLSPA